MENKNIQPEEVLQNAGEGCAEPAVAVANNGSKKTLIVAGSVTLLLLVAGIATLLFKKHQKKTANVNTETEEETVVE